MSSGEAHSGSPEGATQQEDESVVPLGVLALIGFSITVVSLRLWNHTQKIGSSHDLYLMPGIFVLLGSAGGLVYLFYSAQGGNLSNFPETMSTIMRQPAVVGSIVFVAAVVPLVENLLHP